MSTAAEVPPTSSRLLCSCALLMLYLASFLNFFSLAVTLVPTVSKICLAIGGTTTTVNSETAFVTVTAYAIGNVFKFLFAKYDTALSDHVGRKPVLVISCLAFALRCFILLVGTTAGAFYAAAIVFGTLDVFFAVSVAYLADMLKGDERGKAIGILTGISVGLGFTVGVPLGAVLSEKSIQVPFYIAIASSLAAALVSVAIPSSDVMGVKSPEFKRQLPPDLKDFLWQNNPFSGFGLIRKASRSPLDWLTNYLGQVSQQILQSTFLLFVEGALGYSPAQAGEAFAFVGVSIAIFSPLLIGRYEERPLITTGMILQIVGFFFFSISGSRLPHAAFVALPAFLFIAVGGVWLSAMPSILTKQYPSTEYGAVVGVMAQQMVLAIIPAYGVSVFFSYSISNNATVYWPGSTWVFSSFFLAAAIFVQVHAHGATQAFHLQRRALVVPAIESEKEKEKEKKNETEKSELEPSMVVVNPIFGAIDDVPPQTA